MSAEIDAAIVGAMADAGLSEGADNGGTDTGDTSVDLSTADSTDTGTDGTDATTTEEAVTPGADDAATGADAEFDRELAELGLAAPKPGQRDNRIPYSRIRKIVANAKTKWSEKLKGEHTTTLTERDAKIQAFEAEKREWDAAQHLMQSDPDRYLRVLSALDPRYSGYLTPAEKRQEQKQQQQGQKDPEPTPDVRYEDGSLGYSPDQFSKLRQWDRREAARQAKEDATKEFNDRFGPIEQAFQSTQRDMERVTTVRSHIDKLREQWGAEHIDNPEVQKEIVAYMDANPKASLVASTRAVVMGRIQPDRNKMRTEILAEIQKAPKAAQKAPAAPNKGSSDSAESIDDIIRNAMRGLN